MLGILLQLVTGWSLPVCVCRHHRDDRLPPSGGFRSDVYTDVLEFVLMFVGFGLIMPFAVSTFGGWDVSPAHLPPLAPDLEWRQSFQFILVWFFIALWTLVDPAFHQRCYAAQSPARCPQGNSLVYRLLDRV